MCASRSAAARLAARSAALRRCTRWATVTCCSHGLRRIRYAASPPSRLLQLDPHTLWFSAAGLAPSKAAERKKVEQQDVTKALAGLGERVRYNQLRQQVMGLTACSKRTAQLAIAEACQQGLVVQADGQYRLPL